MGILMGLFKSPPTLSPPHPTLEQASRPQGALWEEHTPWFLHCPPGATGDAVCGNRRLKNERDDFPNTAVLGLLHPALPSLEDGLWGLPTLTGCSGVNSEPGDSKSM